ncbi:hypothetical protein CC78DRAFT_387271 [Lojkania enalia]|uniref:Fungal N-terminal domain-containing protein n=1 Tax=Lojkania enalia TaxID=147567 RepID=A0A9P4K199_9PLEO|nr:hypothetical protein CC78DRAFT_387271 [Didymosphaeria enalia]
MVDPLTIGCSAAQFINLVGQALDGIRYLRHKFKGIKSAPKLIKNIHHELKVFEVVLAQIASLDQSQINDNGVQGFIAAMEECGEVGYEIFLRLSKYNFDNDERGPKRLWKQMLADNSRPELEEYLRKLERAKSSLLANLATANLQITNDFRAAFGKHSQVVEKSLGRVEAGIKRIETSSSHVEAGIGHLQTSLERVEAGISSVFTVSERTYSATLETNDRVDQVADIMRKVDQSIQDLMKSMPDLLNHSIHRALEGQLVDWLNSIEVWYSKSHPQRYEPRKDQKKVDEFGRNIIPKRKSVSSSQDSSARKFSNSVQAFQYLPRYVTSRQAAPGLCRRRKTYLKTFTLPFGFIQTKTTQRLYENVSSTDEIIQKEIIRLEVSIIPFRWLSGRRQMFSVEKVFDQYNRPSWTFTPRTYNIVSKDSMIMLACAKCDIVAIRKLFEYRQASPFDVDAHGNSLMGRALIGSYSEYSTLADMEQCKEIITYILSQGADATNFIEEFLIRQYDYSMDKWWLWNNSVSCSDTEDKRIHDIVEQIWRICLENCHTDAFANPKVLTSLWDASMGCCYAPLDPAFLFQDSHSGFDDLVFENPEKVFSDLVNPFRLPTDQFWRRLIDQQYETMVYVCYGGADSIKSRIFSKHQSYRRPEQRESCFCPSLGSHLLFKLMRNAGSTYRKSQQSLLRQHVHRMTVLLLHSGENPESTCSCQGSWQWPAHHRSVTDVAAAGGLLRVWASALEDAGFDSTRIIEDWRYDAIPNLFDCPQEESEQQRSPRISPLKFMGNVVYTTLSSIV